MQIQHTSPKVLVIGDLILDQYYTGVVERISPEAPVPIVNVKNSRFSLGGAGNVVNNLFEIGIKTIFLATVGKDQNTDILEELLQLKVESLNLIKSSNPTTTKIRIVVGDQQLLRLDFEEINPISEEIELKMKKVIDNHIPYLNILIISDYGKGVISESLCQWAITEGNSRGIKTIVDPKGKNWGKYQNAFLITPNFSEFCEVVGEKIDSNDDEMIEAKGRDLIRKFDLENLLITRSEKGMKLITLESSENINAVARKVFDVTGAGDTVVATVGAFLNFGYDLMEAVKIANYAGGIVVSKSGTKPIKREELSQFFQ